MEWGDHGRTFLGARVRILYLGLRGLQNVALAILDDHLAPSHIHSREVS